MRPLLISFFSAFFFLVIFTHESKSQSNNGFNLEGSLIPVEKIKHGGPPRDGIPAIDQPRFLDPGNGDYSEDERVLGVYYNGTAKAYPVSILNYHEIVNDHFDGEPVVISYCPLCGSGLAFEARVNGQRKSFGVSGLLYNSDVLMYDRETESLWSQLMTQAVTGPLKGTQLTIISTSNTTWKDWKMRHPNTLVLSRVTGFRRDYSRTPYTGYDESRALYFPVGNLNSSYHPKEKVIGLEINGEFKAYPFSELEKSGQEISDQFNKKNVRIIYDRKANTAQVFDSNGNEIPSYVVFWFAWAAFHPNTKVFQAN